MVAAILAGLFVLLKSGERAITLAYKFKPGQVDRYRVTTKIREGNPMPIFGVGSGKAQTQTAILSVTVLRVLPDGSAKVRVSTAGSIGVSSPTRATGPPPYWSAKDITLVISKTGAVKEVTHVPSFGPPAMRKRVRDMAKVLLKQTGLFPKLPDSSVNIGQSWSESARLPRKAGEINVAFTLASDRDWLDGKPVCTLNGRYEGKIDLSDLLKSTLRHILGGSFPLDDISSTVTVAGRRLAQFSQTEGKLLRSRDTGRVELTVVFGTKPGASAAATRAETTRIKANIESDTRLIR